MHNYQILKLREEINKLDRELMQKLRHRFYLVHEIGAVKLAEQRDIEDLAREKELYELYQKWSDELGLDYDFVKKIFTEIISESKNIQKK